MKTAVPQAKPKAAVSSSAAASVNGSATRLVLATRQRRPGYTALLVVLVLGLAALGGWFYTQAGQKFPVVVVIRQVDAGHVVARSDLSTVEVAGEVTAIAGANLGSVVGQRAAVTLLPHMLLQRSMLTAGSGLAVGQAQVGVAVKGGQLPADGLAPGDTVQVLRLPTTGGSPAGDGSAAGPSSGPAAAVVLVAKAVVFSAVADPASSGGTLVTLVVALSAAPVLAAASGAGLVALVRVPA